ncbi:MAG: hypothetical protein IH605_06935 [Burkholderiales bacterium]|nr:hypothetical protein [Burkholderiales bacterium]
MNWDRFAGSWKQFSGKVQEQWSRLRGDESGIDAARHAQLAGSIQLRHGMANEETERQLRDFLDRNRDWDLSGR